jgi:hypothetical protein
MSNNLPTSPGQVNNISDTNAYFSGYYQTTLPVSGQQYDAVLTFFLKRTKGNRSAAEALTATIMSIAQSRGLDPISLIEEFKRYNDDDSFKAALIALLNSDRRSTSKLGYSVVPSGNPYVVRNIGR